MVDSKLGVDGIEHRRFADGPIVSRDQISRGSQCRHGHPRRGRQPRTIMHQLKAAVSEVVQRRDSAFADHRARARMTVCPRRPSGNLPMRARCFPGLGRRGVSVTPSATIK